MDAGEFREATRAVVEDIIAYFTRLPTLRVLPTIKPNYLPPLLPTTAPQNPDANHSCPGSISPNSSTTNSKPNPISSLLTDIHTHILPGLTHWQHPSFFAFFPASTTYPSLLAELYSAAFTAPAFNWLCSPATTELETVMLDWVARALGLPACFLSDSPNQGGGVIQGSASEAVIVVMCAARERAVRRVLEREGLLPASAADDAETLRRREDRAAEVRGRLVALGSEQAHSSTQKAAIVLGMRYRGVRAGLDTGCRITGETLREKMRVVREEEGLEVCFLTVCLGTTATCAVDDFEGVREVVEEERRKGWDVWVHVDAAYAGAVLICPEMRRGAMGGGGGGAVVDGERGGSGEKGGRGQNEEQTEKAMAVLGEFDSFDMNMHKWLGVNFDTSCLYLKHTPFVTNTLTITPSYLLNPSHLSSTSPSPFPSSTTNPPNKPTPPKDYRDYQLPLGRRFRALKIWFVLRCYGVSGLQKAVREHVRLGEVFEGLCRGEEGRGCGVEVVSGARFALTVVRVRAVLGDVGEEGTRNDGAGKASDATDAGDGDVVNDDANHTQTQTTNPSAEINNFGNPTASPPHPPGKPSVTAADNAITKRVYERINASGDLFVTSGVVDGVYAIRFVSANIMATEERWVRRAFEVLVRCVREVRAGEDVEGDGSVGRDVTS